MTEFAKMDAFFFITSMAVIVFAVGMIIVFIYAVKILNDVKYIVRKAKTETDNLAEDLEELRSNVKLQGSKLKYLGKFLTGIYKRRRKS